MAAGKSVYEQTGVDVPGADLTLSAPPPAQQSETETRPEFLLEQFTNVEDQAKAYAEARREMARAQTRADSSERAVAELAQQMEDLRQQQMQYAQPQQGYDPMADPGVQHLIRAYEDGDPVQFVQALDGRAAQIARAAWEMWSQQTPQRDPGPTADPELYASVVMQEMKTRYGDEWTPELMEEVGQAAQPFLSENMPFQETINRLSFVTDAIRNKRLAEQTAQSHAQQQQAAHAKRLGQTAPGGSGRVPGPANEGDAWAERVKAVASRPYWAQ